MPWCFPPVRERRRAYVSGIPSVTVPPMMPRFVDRYNKQMRRPIPYWLVKDKAIAPHIPVIDKSKREDGTFSREDFTFDKDRNVYICPANICAKTGSDYTYSITSSQKRSPVTLTVTVHIEKIRIDS